MVGVSLPGGYLSLQELSSHAGSTVYVAENANKEVAIVKEIVKARAPYWYACYHPCAMSRAT